MLGGLLALPPGARCGWRWVRSFGFRPSHLAVISFVVLQIWLGHHWPLTIWVYSLRQQAGQASYGEYSFVAHWLRRPMFCGAPPWVFGLYCNAFGLTVLWAWWHYALRRQAQLLV